MQLDTQIYTACCCDPVENIVISHIESSREEGVEGMRIDENQEIIESLTTFSDVVSMKASRFFPRNLLEAGWKYKCIAFYAFYLGLLPFLLPDLSAPLSYTNSALPKAPLLLI